MTRMVFDCRELPGSCTLSISGTEEEVLAAQALHAVAAHEQSDGSELREFIRAYLKEAAA